MGINSAYGLPLRITFSLFLPFFLFIFFFYCGKMNLAISLGLILSAVMVTARMVKPGGETNNYVDKATAIREKVDEEIVQTAVAEKEEIKGEMADQDKKDEAEFGEVDDAKSNKVDLRQKIPCGYCDPYLTRYNKCERERKRGNNFMITRVQAKTCKGACRHHRDNSVTHSFCMGCEK